MKFAEQLIQRVERAGDLSPGAFHLAADLVDLCVIEAQGWTNRPDDAERIPDALYEGVMALRDRAEAEPTSD